MRIVSNLAKRIKGVYSAFDEPGFCRGIKTELDSLSFCERWRLIPGALTAHLPGDSTRSAQILMDSVEPELAAHPEKTAWDGFIVVPETEFVAETGINHFHLAMDVLKR